MIRWILYAFRNLLRNRRRSLYTVVAIGVGFTGINFFAGFTEYMFTNLREGFIYIDGNGHLSIFKKSGSNDKNNDPLKNLLSEDEILKIRHLVVGQPFVKKLSEVMLVTGFISNGDSTTIYVGNAWLPSEKYAFQQEARGMLSRLKFFDGEPLDDGRPFDVGVSQGLAEVMDSTIGSDVIFMAPTVHGQINAVDAHVAQLVGTSMEILEDKWAVMPLSLARSLHDTGGASRINVLLQDDADLPRVRSSLQDNLTRADADVVVKTWRELSPFFVKVEKMFDIIFGLVFITVSLIIVMSVVNTVTMSVLERSREIGTLRAIGARRGHIVMLFSLEGALLGVLGCSLGLLLLSVTLAGFGWADPHWTPPHLSGSLPLEIYVVPQYLVNSAVLLILLALISGSLPARKIARANIVEALGHV